VVLTAVLLRIERRRNPEASIAIWIPTFFLLLSGSKPIGKWIALSAGTVLVSDDRTGSLPDRVVLIVLIILALLILYRRKIEWSRVLKDNFWLILFYLYLGSSILWSEFPFNSFKRWVRLFGTIPIAMVILSERSSLKALESVIRRCAYVLIPFSLLLIKYYPQFGVQYSRYEGIKQWVGIAGQKNSFGVICAVSVFLIFWTFLRERRIGSFFKTRSQAFADGLVLSIALHLIMGFRGVYPATAIGILVIGIASLLLLYRIKNNVRNMSSFLVIMVVVGLLCMFFGTSLVSIVTSVFGRNESLTGRSDIWPMVIDAASNSRLLGVGYGGFWGLSSKSELILETVGVTESHSGYLDVYLEAGIVGVIFLLVFFRAFYRKALRELNHSYGWGLFGICLLIMTMIHGFTESNFIRTAYLWSSMIFVSIGLSGTSLHKEMEADSACDGCSHI
jgi:O-antigen ligase